MNNKHFLSLTLLSLAFVVGLSSSLSLQADPLSVAQETSAKVANKEEGKDGEKPDLEDGGDADGSVNEPAPIEG